MRKRSTEQLAKFEAAFQKYLDAYMTGRGRALLSIAAFMPRFGWHEVGRACSSLLKKNPR